MQVETAAHNPAFCPAPWKVCVWAQGTANQGAGRGRVAVSEGEEELRSMSLGPALQQCFRKIY